MMHEEGLKVEIAGLYSGIFNAFNMGSSLPGKPRPSTAVILTIWRQFLQWYSQCEWHSLICSDRKSDSQCFHWLQATCSRYSFPSHPRPVQPPPPPRAPLIARAVGQQLGTVRTVGRGRAGETESTLGDDAAARTSAIYP